MAEETKSKVMTTDAGRPVGDNQNSLTVGDRGPIVFEDFLLFEKMAHFNRERVPERVVHAKGSGAYGTLTVTNPDMPKYTTAKLFEKVGKQTPMFLRFSTVGGEKGSADSERDPRGFAMKYYTEEGNWDLVGNNTPVFFIRDPLKFSDFIHTQKRDPQTNLKSATMMWDFWSLSPESLHQVTILFSDRGTPDGFRHMNGYGSHTFSLINAKNELFYVKWHFKTKQGIKNFTREEADHMKSVDMDHSQNDLFHAIEKGDFPKWKVQIQIMPEAEAETYHINPFDLTKRLISYPDAHRYRIGVNYNLLPVNEPKCPYSTYNRDGSMRFNANGGGAPNYEPNSFGGPTQDPKYVERPTTYGTSTVGRFSHREHDGDYYTQPGNLFRLMKQDAQQRLVGNIAASLGQVETRIQDLQINHFYKCDPKYGEGIAKALGRKIEEIVKKEELVTA